jgi:hypothetical protein
MNSEMGISVSISCSLCYRISFVHIVLVVPFNEIITHLRISIIIGFVILRLMISSKQNENYGLPFDNVEIIHIFVIIF